VWPPHGRPPTPQRSDAAECWPYSGTDGPTRNTDNPGFCAVPEVRRVVPNGQLAAPPRRMFHAGGASDDATGLGGSLSRGAHVAGVCGMGVRTIETRAEPGGFAAANETAPQLSEAPSIETMGDDRDQLEDRTGLMKSGAGGSYSGCEGSPEGEGQRGQRRGAGTLPAAPHPASGLFRLSVPFASFLSIHGNNGR
jgi:hypothetical protein